MTVQLVNPWPVASPEQPKYVISRDEGDFWSGVAWCNLQGARVYPEYAKAYAELEHIPGPAPGRRVVFSIRTVHEAP
jgi:hypothetical protein